MNIKQEPFEEEYDAKVDINNIQFVVPEKYNFEGVPKKMADIKSETVIPETCIKQETLPSNLDFQLQSHQCWNGELPHEEKVLILNNNQLTDSIDIEEKNVKKELTDNQLFVRIKITKMEFKTKNFVCNLCFKVFESWYLLNIHKLSHRLKSIEDNYNQEQSIKQTFQSQLRHTDNKSIQNFAINSHKTINSDKKLFKCDICSYKSVRKSYLKKHLFVHDTKKPFQCDKCDYSCSQSGRLVIHQLIHSKDKRYQCDVCDFKTMRSNDLNKHKMIHSGIKPFGCDVCDYKCRRFSSMTIHALKHCGIRPLKCDQCHYRCSLTYHLKRHKLIHSKRMPTE